jgi:hypothetical protein
MKISEIKAGGDGKGEKSERKDMEKYKVIKLKLIKYKFKTLVPIPCIIEYVEKDQQNTLNYILLFISHHMK